MGAQISSLLATPPTPAQNYGRRLIPTLIDQTARSNPEKPYFSIPNSPTSVELGFQTVTYLDIANAVNRMAWWLEEKVGRPSQSSHPIAYVGPQDIRYAILTLASVKAGYKLMFTSPRNSIEGNLALVDSTQCKVFLTTATVPQNVKAVLAQRAMRSIQVPAAADFIDPTIVEHYPYDKTFDDARDDPFLLFHTSGSTGVPKVVTVTNGAMATLDAQRNLAKSEEEEVFMKALDDSTRLYLAFPAFHAAGGTFMFAGAVFCGATIVYGPVDAPLTADVANAVHERGQIDVTALPPFILVDIAKSPVYLENLRKLRLAITGGGPLPKAAGDQIRHQTMLCNTMASTETMLLPGLLKGDQSDWEYFQFASHAGLQFRHHSGDLFEMVIVRDRAYELFQGVFQSFPHLEEYAMKDLFSKHPVKPNLWRYRGRADDIIVFVNGEKLDPVTMEKHIECNPEVQSALIVGHGQFQAALLVQAKGDAPTSDETGNDLMDRIWPTVEEANRLGPAHGKIIKSLITFTSPDKPMPRAGKGTVIRSSTFKLYEAEIDALYAAADASTTVEKSVELNLDEPDSLRTCLRQLLRQASRLGDFVDDEDFFQLGLNSLEVLQLVRSIKVVLERIGEDVSQVTTRLVYSQASLHKLSSALLHILRPNTSSGADGTRTDRTQRMRAMLEKYSADLPKGSERPLSSHSHLRRTVLLTGSTGSLGSYLLDALLEDPNTIRVYCLNRSDDAEQRQNQRNASQGLRANWLPGTVEFIRGDLSQTNLGLQEWRYLALGQEVTHVLHNAWEVDFNLGLESFEPVHVAGVRHLIEFAAKSCIGASIFFVSSVGTVTNWNQLGHDEIPEKIFEDYDLPEKMGYAESKHIAERLLAIAGRVSNVRSSVCRVGQIAGSTTAEGVWNTREWLPTLVASSRYLGMNPDTLGLCEVVDWIPVDILAEIIVELLDDEATTRSTRVLHAVNPKLASWKDLLPVVRDGLGKNVKVVPYPEWLEALRASATKHNDVGANPGIKLLDFFERLQATASDGRAGLRLATTETAKHSRTMRELQPVGKKWMANWMRQWAYPVQQ